jgi:phenylpropionate dioxygenase-like ring-hydroxylating dioxygenase large terminal subunit
MAANPKIDQNTDGVVEAEPRVERPYRRFPKEGDNGLYSQTWYPICMSEEVSSGEVIGREFLGGRVAVFRGENGEASVLSPYCAHLGMDLAKGKVVGNNLQCLFHRYEYDQTGTCVKTGWGPMPPEGTCVFRFPVVERYNIIWVFNGTKPLFELPDMRYPDEDLHMHTWQSCEMTCNITEIVAQVPDWGHLRFMHGDTMVTQEPNFEFSDFHFGYEVTGMHFEGEIRDSEGGEDYPQVRIHIYGTQIMRMELMVNGTWVGSIGAQVPRRPGKVEMFGMLSVSKDSGSEQERDQTISWVKKEVDKTFVEDTPIYENIRFKPNAFTEMDNVLERYLDYVCKFPKANPAANFIYDD